MKFLKKSVVFTVIAVLLIGGGASFALWRHNHKSAQSQPASSTSTSNQSGITTTTTDNGSQKVAGNPQPTATGTAPAAPSGAFVSNHKPTLSSPANQMNSICRTSLGANCEIRFTKGSEVKTLGPGVVGADGSISWDWKLQDIGINGGSWQIQAVATLNGKAVSTTDPLTLEVGQ